MKKSVCAIFLMMSLAVIPARSQAAREATIEPETKARIVLQSQISSKLNEVGDTITAVLDEPIYVNGLLVLPRGTEFHGRVTSVAPARRGQKSAQIGIIFDRLAMAWGEEPVAVQLTAIDDWEKNEKLKANDEGKVKGGHRGDKTVDNVERGARIGSMGAGAVILSGAAAGGGPGVLAAGAASIGAGMLGGLLLTKGSEVRLQPGAIFRIKFVKPITLPVIAAPGSSPRPIQQNGANPSPPDAAGRP